MLVVRPVVVWLLPRAPPGLNLMRPELRLRPQGWNFRPKRALHREGSDGPENVKSDKYSDYGDLSCRGGLVVERLLHKKCHLLTEVRIPIGVTKNCDCGL